MIKVKCLTDAGQEVDLLKEIPGILKIRFIDDQGNSFSIYPYEQHGQVIIYKDDYMGSILLVQPKAANAIRLTGECND